jgi:hypothetical protein
MDNSIKIKELRDEIKRLENEQDSSQVEKYRYLVGFCFHRAFTSWEKITEIRRVEYDEYKGDEIHFDSISMYFDPIHNNDDRLNQGVHITFDYYGDIYAKDIERSTVTEDKFSEVFEECVKFMRTKL